MRLRGFRQIGQIKPFSTEVSAWAGSLNALSKLPQSVAEVSNFAQKAHLCPQLWSYNNDQICGHHRTVHKIVSRSSLFHVLAELGDGLPLYLSKCEHGFCITSIRRESVRIVPGTKYNEVVLLTPFGRPNIPVLKAVGFLSQQRPPNDIYRMWWFSSRRRHEHWKFWERNHFHVS